MGEENEEELEHQHYVEVLHHFYQYEATIGRIVDKMKRDWDSLSPAHRELVPEHEIKIKAIRRVARQNQEILSQMIKDHWDGITADTFPDNKKARTSSISSERAQENLRSLLRQIHRDWTDEGQCEREAAYGPILSALATVPKRSRVLVPGAGLGRLLYEICKLGFEAEGNEFSHFMLLPSEYILNACLSVNSHTIYPWILPCSNQIAAANQLRPVRFPDTELCLDGSSGSMSMVAGDFLQVYGHGESDWDAIVTCFFLDTAKNVIEYMERFYALLKPAGLWINHGPLLYHFEGSMADCSIELSLEEIKLVAKRLGFVIEQDHITSCRYTADAHSMYQTEYTCSFMVLRKT